MKRLIFTLILSMSSLVFAGSVDALPTSLKETMKGMGSTLKTISMQISDSAKNPSSAALADQFARLVTHAKNFTPDIIESLPASERAAKKADYDKKLDQVVKLAEQLAAAFRANNNSQAAQILQDLSQSKREGHEEFKE